MRKIGYLAVGILAGSIMTVSFSAAAEQIESMIGKTVESQAPVILDGMTLEVPAVVIDDTSYAPVRAVSEAAGLAVEWEDNKVVLTKKEDPKKTERAKYYQEKESERKELQKQIEQLRKELSDILEKTDDYLNTKPSDRKITAEEYVKFKNRQKEIEDEIAILDQKVLDTYKPMP